MSLTFYFVPNSTSNVTAAVLDELEIGLPSPLAKRIELSIQAGDTRSPHYLSTVNPNGRVPAIVHEGVSIWESAATTIYLGETFGAPGNMEGRKDSLYPPLGPKRGEALEWIVWGNMQLADAAARLASTLEVGSPGAVEEGSWDYELEGTRGNLEAVGAKAKEDIAHCLDILDGALRDRDFLLGKEYCLADTHVWSFASYAIVLGVRLDDYANVQKWMTTIGNRPALKDG